MGTEVVLRTIEVDGKRIHQASYDGEHWMDIAVVTGDTRPRFYYGKPWTDHVRDR